MINRVIHFGVPNTPEHLREHLAHHGRKVSLRRANRLAALYNLMLKTPAQWTDPITAAENPFALELEEYKGVCRATAWGDVKLLLDSGLVFPFKRPPTMLERLQNVSLNYFNVSSALSKKNATF